MVQGRSWQECEMGLTGEWNDAAGLDGYRQADGGLDTSLEERTG